MTVLDAAVTTLVYTVSGNVSVADIALPVITLPYDVEVVGVQMNVLTAPLSTGISVNLKANGSLMYSTAARPTIAASATEATAVKSPDLITTLTAGQTLVATVATIGTGTVGANLTVCVAVRKR